MNNPIEHEAIVRGLTAAPVASTVAAPAFDWRAATQRVAAIAAQYADEVDREARFPSEAVDALRREKLLSAMVPIEYGGAGLKVVELGEICETLAMACASTAMIYAMHLIEIVCIDKHGSGLAWQRGLLRQVVEHELLLASATSEENIGGNLRNSSCAVEIDGAGFRLEKLAPTISYGAHADGILVTARRTPESNAADQVLVVVLKANTSLEKRGEWDSLGMRGTCSEGFRLVATGVVEQIIPTPFAEIADQTMLPLSHTLWASVWTGIASDAVRRASAFFRAQARAKPGSIPSAGPRLADAVGLLYMMKARLSAGLEAAQRVQKDIDDVCRADVPLAAILGFATDMNTLKTSISNTALQVVQEVLMICGMAGYKNGTEYSVGRHLRDLYSAPLMISNDRIVQNTASLLMTQRPV
jgi:acyl-CoA dehydrogenase